MNSMFKAFSMLFLYSFDTFLSAPNICGEVTPVTTNKVLTVSPKDLSI